MSGTPPVIRRNALYLSAGQALHTMILQVNVVLAAIVLFLLSGSAALAGLGGGIMWGGRILIVYQSGRLMDRWGRRRILQLGVALCAVAVVVLGLSVAFRAVPSFLVGLVVFGVGTGAFQQNRVAVADMYPTTRRGQAVGYLLTASIVGAVLATLFVAFATQAASQLGYDPYMLSYFACLALLAPISFLVGRVRPDTREIARNLEQYYGPLPEEAERNHPPQALTGALLMSAPLLISFAVSSIAQGNMTMVMATVSLVLHEHHVDLVGISSSISVHFFGMFALAFVLGRFADHLGRRAVLFLGAGLSGIGSLLTPLTSDFWIITGGSFLVGLGWSAATVATTAVIADVTHPLARGRVTGANDTAMALAALTFPIMGGVVLQVFGFVGLGVVGLLAAVPALVVPVRLRELRPGIYQPKFASPVPSTSAS